MPSQRLSCVTLSMVSLLCLPTLSGKELKRPRILGIDSVQIYVTDVAAETNFFRTMEIKEACSIEKELYAQAHYSMTGWCEWLPENSFLLDALQAIRVSQMPQPAPKDLLKMITFSTNDIPELRRYLVARGIIPSKRRKPDMAFTVVDPEGHVIGFREVNELPSYQSPLVPLHIIHAGFIVRDRPAMEHFYKDILGFRPYWHGGMKDDETTWVSLQVPDGTDWLEFMLYDPTGKDKHFLGVMNHIALGVTDIHAAQEQLRKNGAPLTEEPKIGRDGKWQLNLYDPDETRIEFMEFTPVQKPCCSEFTAPHPKP